MSRLTRLDRRFRRRPWRRLWRWWLMRDRRLVQRRRRVAHGGRVIFCRWGIRGRVRAVALVVVDDDAIRRLPWLDDRRARRRRLARLQMDVFGYVLDLSARLILGRARLADSWITGCAVGSGNICADLIGICPVIGLDESDGD